MPQLNHQPDETPVSLYNPDKEDFTITWAGEPHTIHAGEIETYPKWLADHMAKHLCKKLIGDRGIKVNYEADYEKIMKEIQTDL